MALQGTLDTFALPDVLRLLASTKKTGRLRLTGDRGSGSLWLEGGGVVDAESTGGTDASTPADVVFELLRYHEGSFTFEVGSTAPRPGVTHEVEPLLAGAEQQLAEWRDIEAVVPSLDAWVTLVPELAGDEVTLDSKQWRTVATVGSGTTVAEIADALGLGEVAVCRVVKDLVESGLGTIDAAQSATESDPEPEVEPEPMVAPYVPTVEARIEDVGQDVFPSPVPPPPPPLGPVTPVPFDEVADSDDVARQLATLSPRAARAVAAAARAETEEEREAALAEATNDDDTPINRGLLLKFLGSVKSEFGGSTSVLPAP